MSDISQECNEWYEAANVGGTPLQHVSKFLRADFSISVEEIRSRWQSWNSDQQLEFAGAFAAKGDLTDKDVGVLDFLMERGDNRVWSAIALLIALHPDRKRALEFLVARINEEIGPLANYYQALEKIGDVRCVSVLKRVLLHHYEQTKLISAPLSRENRFVYLDYLSCAAALFILTGGHHYKEMITEMESHSDEEIRKIAHLVARSSGVALTG